MNSASRCLPLGASGRAWVGVLMTACGFQAIVTQSLLLREALVLMFGSELVWGIVLFAWLFGVAIGAGVGGRLTPVLRRTDWWLAGVLAALSVATCLELWIFRGARGWLGVAAGELLPLPQTALAAMVFISPCSALIGLAFPLACSIAARPAASASAGTGPLAGIYALEAAGSLAGGAVFSFWAVEHLAPIQTAIGCGAITTGCAVGLLFVRRSTLHAAVACFLTVIVALVACLPISDMLDERLVERRWSNLAPGYRLCAEAESRYQNLAVGQRAEQFTLYCNGQVAADFPDPYTFVPLAHFWMCQHPSPGRVLIVGGGAEGLLVEVLRYPVEHVDYIEPDPRQLQMIEAYLTDADRAALADPRVTVHQIDARHFVKTQRGRFDLVIARLPEPTSALRARFYTREFFGELGEAMTGRSVLCMTAAAAPASLPRASAAYLASIRASFAEEFPDTLVGWGDPAHVIAATETGLITSDPDELARRHEEAGGQSPSFDALWFRGATDWLDRDKLEQRMAELDGAGDVQISTDLRPIVYIQRLALWERMTSGRSGVVIERLGSITWLQLVACLGVVHVVVLGVFRIRSRSRSGWGQGAVVVSVGTSGLATMALSIIWLFAFQNLYGYVYQRIGWIIAIFMGGLVIGCLAVTWRARRVSHTSRWFWQRLIVVDLLIALLALAVPVVLPALGRLQSTPLALGLVEWSVSLLVIVTGVLGGAAFALAAGVQLSLTNHTGKAAGVVDAADHAGACVGALLTGILLVPIFGTVGTALFLVGLKVVSAMLLWILGRRCAGTMFSLSV